MMRWRAVAALCALMLASCSSAQQEIDLFSDQPRLGDGFIRFATWNLRHINVEGDAGDFLPAATEEGDFDILIATFAKAIDDLGLHLVLIVEHQPRAGEPNRLAELEGAVDALLPAEWRHDESHIEYDGDGGQFGNLQFGLLWDASRVTIDPDADQVLESLRQSRNLRAPWLAPVRAGGLEFDLLALHLKSGGAPPQADEVAAVAGFIRQHQSQTPRRHLIIAGDWNIRPDQSSGRSRLRQFITPPGGGTLMRVLTVDAVRPTLEQWEQFDIASAPHIAPLLPYTHFNASSMDTFLDHVAISLTLNEVFDDPIRVTLSGGGEDLRPGIHVAYPHIAEADYVRLTDHLPVVLTLRTTAAPPPPGPTGGMRIVAILPNPHGDDVQFEAVHLRNNGAAPRPLAGWRIQDAAGDAWILTAEDGTAAPGATVIVVRRGRNMFLNNDGDEVALLDDRGVRVDTRTYGQADSGRLFRFD